MRLRQLFEAPESTATMAFGRMNPPTIGHAKLVDAVKSQGGDPYIFLSQSQKPKTDPLAFADKLRYAKFFFPEVTIGNPEVKTIIQALQKIDALGYNNLIYVAGSDRVASFEELINKYNGVEYNFKSIKVVSAGERDPDADGAEGMSASKMRAAAAADDLESFKQGVPNPEVADEMFAAVRAGMGIRDEEPVAAESTVDEGMFGIDSSIKGKIQNIVSELSDVPGMWDHKAQTFTDIGLDALKSVLKNNPKYIKYATNLTADDFDADLEGIEEADALLDPLKGAYGELFGKQPKEEAPEKIALDQAMEKYKNNPKGLKAWLMKNRNILVWLNTSQDAIDSQLLDIVKQRIRETTTAGGIASSMGSGNDFDDITLQRILKFADDRDRYNTGTSDAVMSTKGTNELIAKARAQAKRERISNTQAHAHNKDGVHSQGFKKVKFDPVELSPELKVQLGLGRSGKMKLADD